MGRYRNCAVFGCENTDASRHRFPLPKKRMELYKKWITACKNETISALDPELVYQSHRVCHIHFRPEDHSTNMRIKNAAVPCLHLSEDSTSCIKSPPSASITNNPISLHTSEEDIFQAISHSNDDIITSTPKRSTVFDDPSTSSINDPNLVTSTPEKSFTLAFEGPSSSAQIDTYSTQQKRKFSDSYSLLQEVGVTRINQLSPKAKKLYQHAQYFKTTSKRYKKKNIYLQKRICTAKNMNEDEVIDQLTGSMNDVAKEFIKAQLKSCAKKPKGRRHSIQAKILGLILNKQSSRGYKLFSKFFVTPSKKTLSTFLQRIPIDSGVSEVIFENLKSTVQHLNDRDKICCLMFDEMSIQPHLQFEPYTNKVYGFENLGYKCTSQIADHAQVFMIRGVLKKWKQPICYTFTKTTIKSMDLVRLVKLIVTKCQEAGLKVICTVCDQGSTNVAAINYLKKRTVEECMRNGIQSDNKNYSINGKKIFHIYDPPHLIKGIRNNLLSKNLVWQKGNEKLVAKWSDVEVAYTIDNIPGELRSMPKLTNSHIDRRKMKKMKVCCATQVLSYSVASVIGLFARSGLQSADGQHLEPRAKHTATIFKFFDELFDSVNGGTLYNKGGKPLRCAASIYSPHTKFWRDAKHSLKQMYFQKEGTTEKVIPPSLKNWVETLTSFEEILKLLNGESISFFMPRNLNQDAVENFFGQVRQGGMRNVNPTAANFKYSFRTLLINNLASVHSLSANCQVENSKNLLECVKEFIMAPVRSTNNSTTHLNAMISLPESLIQCTAIDKMAIGYVGGFIAKNIKEVSVCGDCKLNIICSNIDEEWHALVAEKEFVKKVPHKLRYCTPEYLKGLLTIYNIINYSFPKICHHNDGFSILLNFLYNNVNFKFKIQCEHHDFIKKTTIEKFAKLCCFNYCDGVNKILFGKATCRYSKDAIYNQAHVLYLKRCRKSFSS